MHETAFNKMEELLVKYEPPGHQRVLDVGSAVCGGGSEAYQHGQPILGGTYRYFIEPKPREWFYAGLDLAPAPNVDIVSPNPYNWPMEPESWNIIISGQCMEHVEDVHAWMAEMFRVLTPGGLAIIIAPSGGPYHAFPLHCWLIMKDGMRYTMQRAGFEVLEADQWDKPPFNDCWGVGRKPA